MRCIDKQAVVSGPLEDVWAAWTTSEGARAFFAPDARIALELDGPYEILFDLDEPVGSQGSEGMRVLSFVPQELLSFEWNAPPSLPAARTGPRTFVVVQLERRGADRTHVRLRHLGWERLADPDPVFAYFDRAWGFVLFWLQHRFAVGPVDWSNPPRPGAPPPAGA